jgi:hypothetical protein
MVRVFAQSDPIRFTSSTLAGIASMLRQAPINA